jgi:hypothetical protein
VVTSTEEVKVTAGSKSPRWELDASLKSSMAEVLVGGFPSLFIAIFPDCEKSTDDTPRQNTKMALLM